MHNQNAIAAVVREFALSGTFVSAIPVGSGHIHETFRITLQPSSGVEHVILQCINPHIFPDVPSLMHNLERVLTHLAGQLRGEMDADRKALSLIPTREGTSWTVDGNGQSWRSFYEIPRTRTFDAAESAAQAFEAAKAFGRFQSLLSTLPPPRLHDTISGFHHTPSRFAALREALDADALGRVHDCGKEIEFALAREPLCHVLLGAGLPERVTHNDTKLNNVLFDERSGEGICVIDLDTVMPGLAPYDFGDMVRTTTCSAAEDERDLSQVAMDFEFFEALMRGFLEPARSFLTREEKLCLADAGQLITYEQGIRFLADHLRGDTYYKVHRSGQNLDRCRVQFKLLRSMEAQQAKMEELAGVLAEE
jgi:Phosphotransferase enzyme family